MPVGRKALEQLPAGCRGTAAGGIPMRIQKGPYCLQSVTGSPLGHRPPADGPSRSALMRSSVLKAKLITLTQPENFRFQLAACGKAKKFSDRKIACGRPDIVGDRPSAGMISDYCDFTMSSTFSPTGQLLDVKRVDDRKSARLRRPWAYQEALLTLI